MLSISRNISQRLLNRNRFISSAAPHSGGYRRILLVTKRDDPDTLQSAESVISWLKQQPLKSQILVEPHLKSFKSQYFQDTEPLNHENQSELDYVISIGGDGTLLHVSSLFPDSSPPPIVSFSMGTLGFLMPFDIADFKETLKDVVLSGALHSRGSEYAVQQRSRLSCTLRSSDNCSFSTVQAMNEIVIQRSSSLANQHLLSLDIKAPAADGQVKSGYITTATADGLILASPTGSTAYSLSAGGPIVHPSVNSIIMTPICPMSLSFRPVLLPSDMKLLLNLSERSKSSSAEIIVDGKSRGFMQHSCPVPSETDTDDEREDEMCVSSVMVETSKWPVPCVTRTDKNYGTATDWIRDMNEMLAWNQSFKARHNK